MTAVAVMAAIIAGSKRKLFYGWGYGAVSTVPSWRWFFRNTGAEGLGNPSLLFIGCRGIRSP